MNKEAISHLCIFLGWLAVVGASFDLGNHGDFGLPLGHFSPRVAFAKHAEQSLNVTPSPIVVPIVVDAARLERVLVSDVVPVAAAYHFAGLGYHLRRSKPSNLNF